MTSAPRRSPLGPTPSDDDPGAPSRRGDPGLQPERTALAWHRTSVAFVAAACLFLRWVHSLGPAVLAMLALSGGLAAYTILRTRRRLHHLARVFPRGPVAPATAEVLVVTTASLALGGLGLWVALVRH